MSIGAALANARRQAGLTVTQVSQRTRIRETIIQGIERDDFSACGADFYARGHIRAIARVTGVDPEPLVREYDDAREAVAQEDIPLTRPGKNAGPTAAGPAASLPQVPRRTGVPLPGGAPPPPGRSRRAPWSAVLAVLLLAAVGVIAYQVVSSHSGAPPRPRKPAVAAGPTATPQATTSPAATPSGTASPGPSPGTIVISLTVAGEPCWAQLTTADGTMVYQGIVAAGATMTWTENQPVSLRLGNPGSVTLSVDGKVQTGLGVNPVTLSLAPGQQPVTG